MKIYNQIEICLTRGWNMPWIYTDGNMFFSWSIIIGKILIRKISKTWRMFELKCEKDRGING